MTANHRPTPESRDHGSCARTDWPFVARALCSPLVRTIYLWGPPGIGKTHEAYRRGLAGRELFAITLTEDTPASELRGHFLLAGNHMVWHDGPFTAAMRRGGRVVINEVTHGTPEALSLLHPVLESLETARLTLPTNETVTPAPGFQVIATDNAPPEELPPALRDRFDCTLEISEPHPEALALLGERLRRAVLRSIALEPDRRISLRPWLAVQRLEPEFGLHDACIAVFGATRGSQIHDAIVLAEAA